ncbi:Nn.00g066440.m01.CDS01 [Neocucurbitaria sp. VM-36]
MPLCTLHLLALHTTTPNPLQTFLSTLNSTPLSPLVISRVIRWIILPTSLSTEHLLARNISWDLLLILPSTSALPSNLSALVNHHWSVTAGVPSRLTQNFKTKNDRLLHPERGSVPELSSGGANAKTTDSSQQLELSAELDAWINAFVGKSGKAGRGAVSMFNLLSFKPGMKSEYLKYGAAFAESIGSRHGGNAKIVGNVTAVNGVAKATSKEKEKGDGDGDVGGAEWDEIALAHYPSILHFRDMLASEEYQRVNKKHRVPSLRDTCILMTSEIAIEELGGHGGGAKL